MGILSPLYSAVFDGVSFMELGEWHPGISIETDGTLHSSTSGAHFFVDMGRAPIAFEVQAGVEATQRTALEGKRGDSGTLVWSRGTQTAILLDILPTEADAFDASTITLRFFASGLPSSTTTYLLTDLYLSLTSDGGDYLTEG